MIGDNKKGFTLIEVLLALSIFSVVITIAADFFLSFQRTQRTTEALQGVSIVARQVMERIVSEVRGNQIDYAYYTGGAGALPTQTLALVDNEGNKIFFRQEDENSENCPDVKSSPCATMSLNGVVWSSLTPRGVRVRALNFYITPTSDPFLFNANLRAYAANAQPYVTIVLDIEGASALNPARMTLQTGVESRVYRR